MCCVKRPNYGKRNIFHALDAADALCEAPEHMSCFGARRYALRRARIIKNVAYVMPWKPQMCSVNRPNDGKHNKFPCFGGRRCALQSARILGKVTCFMLWRPQMCSVKHPNYGNVPYFMPWRPQMCFAKRPNYGKRSIFHALEAAPETWKT
jgi:hypothetical protein